MAAPDQSPRITDTPVTQERSTGCPRAMPNGWCEVLGVTTAPSEAETVRTEFLRSLAERGLHGVKLVIADDLRGPRAGCPTVQASSD
jgi:hypothetical protein